MLSLITDADGTSMKKSTSSLNSLRKEKLKTFQQPRMCLNAKRPSFGNGVCARRNLGKTAWIVCVFLSDEKRVGYVYKVN